MYKFFFKRFLDFLFALIVLLVLSPIIIIVILILLTTNNGKPFFIQKRPGQNEKIFKILKFKSMNDKKGLDGSLLSDTERLTTIGKIIRKTSFDEIPQLLNVLKGEMSLIGPRPLLPQYLPFYTSTEKKRHSVRPGITGLAQVSGRNNIDWDTKLKFDVEYVENLSFSKDLDIYIKTLKKVISSKDVSVDTTNVEPYLDVLRKDKTH